MAYSPLQNISSYSLLQSTTTVPGLVKAAQDQGYQAVALTDHNVMYGAVAFEKEARRQGIKPIIGLTLTLQGEQLTEHQFELVLLAKNQRGYQHLMEISSRAMTQTDVPTLAQVSGWLSDLFVLLPEQSEALSLLEYERPDDAGKAVQQLQQFADPGAVKIGLPMDLQPTELEARQQLATQTNAELMALNPVNYLKATDYFDVRVLRSIETGNSLGSIPEQQVIVGEEWLRSQAELEAHYQTTTLQAAVQVNQQVVDECNVEIPKQVPHLPQFQTPNHQAAINYLQELCEQGLAERLADNVSSKYQQRLQHELDVIDRMGFSDYFLIVWDVINFAHQHHIITGPGRGSAAGSLVAYALRITDVDPIRYDLLFERFLNEERAQMPDIDMDIPDDQRDEILRYVHDRYGDTHVAQIITFGTLGAKQAIRDVGRVFGMRPEQMNQWSTAIPNHLNQTLDHAVQESKKLQNLIADQPLNETLFQTARQLEGLPRHYSTHAAGVILSDQPIVQKSPVQTGNEGLLMTQYSKYYVEDVGLLKIDFLGLRNLSIMANILKMVHEQLDPAFDVTKIDLNDEKTMELFQAGRTNGVFQFESSGIKNVLRRMHPDRFELIAAVNALYRPGPMENIDSFIKRKNGEEEYHYQNDAIKAILGSTYGIIVYQEQVMQLASTMAGFSLGQADVLRRAMSKKHHQEMESMRVRFVSGSVQNGYSQQTAEQTFAYIEQFASYGFNKSHAVAYSKMAVELAYLKVHFPGPFFTALLNSVVGNQVKIRSYIQEAKDDQINVLAPDINLSQLDFTYQDGAIRFGFRAIKGLRSDFIRALLQARNNDGPFQNLDDLIQRLPPNFRKVEPLQTLAAVGAFDQFGYNRREISDAIPKFISAADLSGSLLASIPGMEVEVAPKSDWPEWQKINYESEYLGTFLSGHPVERYDELKQTRRALRSDELVANQKNVTLVLLVNRVKTIRTKKGQQMAFVTASDQVGEVNLTLFPNLYRDVSEWLQPNRVILVTGDVEERRGLQVVANRLQLAANVVHQQKTSRQRLFVQILASQEQPELLQQLQSLLKDHEGSVPVILYWARTKKRQQLAPIFNVDPSEELMLQLQTLLGPKNVVLK
ncbi:DNA polymerase III subunit alpha [Fructilactobacillus carniphilus]|uniref:DNA polymerase III subunit alpha n=1 Tax=Fructilactobacillus carniphilus TaxID=2940297 RepID=A0ABY5BX13_9LACO|nr:DNA polymerase III subunit alpha [Fructilactobacillus carniphilus]USS91044.1 DNA polymerase III subunit alpha [Fructilactobacillus carniphilus]